MGTAGLGLLLVHHDCLDGGVSTHWVLCICYGSTFVFVLVSGGCVTLLSATAYLIRAVFVRTTRTLCGCAVIQGG